MSEASPIDIVRAFGRCIHARDSASAERFCTELGWASRGNSGRRLYRQLSRQEVKLQPKDFDYDFEDRAMVPAEIQKPDTTSPFSTIGIFLVNTERGWRIEGFSKSHKMSALFLAKEIPAILGFTDLPDSPDGLAWAKRKLTSLRARTIYTEEDIQANWNAPCFGAIPYQVPGDIVSPRLTDAIHHLGPTINRILTAPPTLIAITSTTKEAGCSMVSGAVATSFAAQGERVLIVDLHPTQPNLHQRFKVNETSPGLSEMATGKTPFTDCIKETHHQNIRFLSAGSTSQTHPMMLACLEELQPLFDRIVINAPDNPEIGPFINRTNGLLAYVIALGKSTLTDLKQVSTMDDVPPVPRLGYVVNLVPAGNLDEANERLRESKRAKGSVEVIGARYFEAVDRVAVGFRTQLADEKYSRDQWRVLTRQRETGVFVERYVSPVPMMDLLLEGLDVDFDDGKLSINELSTGIPVVKLAEPAVTEESEPIKVIDLDSIRKKSQQREKQKGPIDFESNLKGLLEGYVNENLGSMDSAEFMHRVKADPQFVQKHAPAFLVALFTEMTRSLVPTEIKISTSIDRGTPSESEEQDGSNPEASNEEGIKIKVDFRDIFGSLFSTGEPKNTTDKE